MGLEEEFKFLDQKDFGTEAVECYPELQSCAKVLLILSSYIVQRLKIWTLITIPLLEFCFRINRHLQGSMNHMNSIFMEEKHRRDGVLFVPRMYILFCKIAQCQQLSFFLIGQERTQGIAFSHLRI